ncbi:hypothetical protein BU25DRAFT_415692 [Macroventuria anomochaeta]|uniref:Uncharacterized protein n=1 Tax=Macroventuria anomochaeta TaxID=301207 RepID=A0ACB6RL03_9PLEO|nr:uncharacterized protein BU25DRAFT_415692 [Macroventuria anomochaeta]KAF2621839.1 hypothetical protein BU25DRAFT_415692 [Macroventuria anomochaeta]
MAVPLDNTKTALTCMHLQHDDRQLLEQLHHFQRCLNGIQQRLYEKSVTIQNLQENFNRERSAMAYEISTLKMKLALEERKGELVARERKNSSVNEEGVSDGTIAGTNKLQDGLEQAEERTSKPPLADCRKVQHQALEPKSQKEQAHTLVQRRLETAASTSPLAIGTESWEPAHETALPSVEHAPQQGQGQGQGQRKRTKRPLRRGDCS